MFQWVSESNDYADMLEVERMQRPLHEEYTGVDSSSNTHLVKPRRSSWEEKFISLFKIVYEIPSNDFPLSSCEYYAIRFDAREVDFKHPFTGEVNNISSSFPLLIWSSRFQRQCRSRS